MTEKILKIINEQLEKRPDDCDCSIKQMHPLDHLVDCNLRMNVAFKALREAVISLSVIELEYKPCHDQDDNLAFYKSHDSLIKIAKILGVEEKE